MIACFAVEEWEDDGGDTDGLLHGGTMMYEVHYFSSCIFILFVISFVFEPVCSFFCKIIYEINMTAISPKVSPGCSHFHCGTPEDGVRQVERE